MSKLKWRKHKDGSETAGPGCEEAAKRLRPCAVCGSLHPNPECETCVGAQLAREVARLLELKELEED